MKKILRRALIAILVLVLALALLVMKFLSDMRKRAEDQSMMVKSDADLIGERLRIRRTDGDDVNVNLYLSNDGESLPLVVNVHGGAFIAGDADALDTQSDRVSKAWNVHVAAVNYKLANERYDIPYAAREIADTVKYFIDNAAQYRVDPANIYVMGYSAGGYHAMASALRLHEEGIDVAGQILCYAYPRDILDLYANLPESEKASVPPALFVVAGGDPIGEGSLRYEAALREAGVETDVKTYPDALHGFIEENNPEYEKLHNHASMAPEQEILARDAENYIGNWITRHVSE